MFWVPFAEAEVDDDASGAVESCGGQAAEGHALAEEGALLLDVVIEALEVELWSQTVLRTGWIVRQRALVEPSGLGVALFDAPSVVVAQPQVGDGIELALCCAELGKFSGALVALRDALAACVSGAELVLRVRLVAGGQRVSGSVGQ